MNIPIWISLGDVNIRNWERQKGYARSSLMCWIMF